mmetsp:Transcript_34344/g.67560  ORF Transcript_34344/g.67560 Transcript_34344/m.67560 type:complete len:80 (+) Transcript_34344:1221-1460(+)
MQQNMQQMHKQIYVQRSKLIASVFYLFLYIFVTLFFKCNFRLLSQPIKFKVQIEEEEKKDLVKGLHRHRPLIKGQKRSR